LPNVPISLRRRRRPCSGLIGPVPYLGPPIAPRRTACADLAAERAESVRGVRWASIEACDRAVSIGECGLGAEVVCHDARDVIGRGGLTPPNRCSWKLKWRSGTFLSTTFMTLTASAVT
jgi:hypothetical protein